MNLKLLALNLLANNPTAREGIAKMRGGASTDKGAADILRYLRKATAELGVRRRGIEKDALDVMTIALDHAIERLGANK